MNIPRIVRRQSAASYLAMHQTPILLLLGVVAVLLVAVIVVVAIMLLRPAAPAEVTLGTAGNGQLVTLKADQVLVITLPSNPSTGYRWEVTEVEQSILQQQGEAVYTVTAPKTTPVAGAGGTETFRFKAGGAGRTNLKLVYHRSWETGVAPLQTYSVEVEVQ